MVPDDDIAQRFAAAVKLALDHLPAHTSATAAIPAGLVAEIAAAAASLSKARAAQRAVMVAAPDHRAFWVLQDSGVIHHSSDRRIWVCQPSGTEHDLLAGVALSRRVCWAVGRAGTVLLTTDGVSWAQLASPTETDLIGVVAAGAETATVVAKDGRRYATCDGGRSWRASANVSGAWRQLGNGRRAILFGGRLVKADGGG